MKKFIIKSFLIGLPIIVFIILMEILVRNIPNDYSYKKNYLDKHSTEIEVLILGSSHASYGLNPIYFSDKTFNASHISQSLDYDLEIFYKYQSSFSNLKTIVLPISYFSLFYILKEGPEAWREKNYAIYYDINGSPTLEGHSEVASQTVDLNLKRIYFYYVLNNSFMSCSELGYGLREYFPTADLEKSGTIAAERHSMKFETDLNAITQVCNEKIKILDKFIQDCKEKKINIIFFTPPAFNSYYNNLDPQQLETTINTAEKLDTKYDNVVYVNLLKDIRFTAKDFHNADHLSDEGAEKLSKIINKIAIETKSNREANNKRELTNAKP